jgi:N-acetylneuraminic acid mutarotase
MRRICPRLWKGVEVVSDLYPVACLEPLESRQLLAQTPYSGSPISVPGTIEAERFDKGGEDVAYHDTTSANQGGQFRTGEGVDIVTGGSNYAVGYTRPGEWIEYTINVAASGTYQFDASVASGNKGGTFHISIDGSDKTGTLNLNNTGGWSTYKTVSKSGVSLAGGTHVLRLSFESAFTSGQDIGNVDWIKLSNSDGSTGSDDDFSPNALSWKSVASNPIKREESQSLVYGGKLYQLGGYVEHYAAITRVDRYDPKTNKWTRMHDMPYDVTHAAVAPDPDGHSFWFVGGFVGDFKNGNGPGATSRVYKYDAASDSWSQKTSLPNAHGSGGAGIINNKLYFFGGADKNRSFDRKEAYVMDLTNQGAGWKRIADLPNPRNHLGGIVAGGKLYAIGGQHKLEDDSVAQSDVHRYDPAKNTWTKVASLPKRLSHFNAATVLYDRYIITVGGENPHNTAQPYVFAYDTALNKWARLTNLPDARRAGVAGLVGSKLIQSTGYKHGVKYSTTYIADLSETFV